MFKLARSETEKKIIEICQKDDLEGLDGLIMFLAFQPDYRSQIQFEIESVAAAYLAGKIYRYVTTNAFYIRSEKMKKNPNKKSGDWFDTHQRQFFNACESGSTLDVSRMIQDGCDLHQYDTKYFISSVTNGHVELTDFLLNVGARSFKQRDSFYGAHYVLHTYFISQFEFDPDFQRAEEKKIEVKRAQPLIDVLIDHGYDINLYQPHLTKGTPLDLLQVVQSQGTKEVQPLIGFMRARGAKTAAELGIEEPPTPG